jgi:hypothetical protein
VITGLAVDLGGTMLASLLIGLVHGLSLVRQGMPPEQVGPALAEVDPRSSYFIVSTVVGGAFSLLGGYVCARMVLRDERKTTAIMALVSAAIALAIALAIGELPWLQAAGIVLTIATVMAGGELGRRRNLALARKADAAMAA